ncbi:MAG TPA: hypothetical protein PLF50_07835 [Candidatus Cloacimonadota bacterium]|nr:hypothetical protein [Candidatus Cloacimonadota bacterium]
MMDDKKKVAAIAAVMSILTDEEKTSLEQKLPSRLPSAWTNYGRQQTMNFRTLYQRRLVKRV